MSLSVDIDKWQICNQMMGKYLFWECDAALSVAAPRLFAEPNLCVRRVQHRVALIDINKCPLSVNFVLREKTKYVEAQAHNKSYGLFMKSYFWYHLRKRCIVVSVRVMEGCSLMFMGWRGDQRVSYCLIFIIMFLELSINYVYLVSAVKS